MQMILACTHASINECMYVHCMMITQNHNKLNNKKYNSIVVFARTPHRPNLTIRTHISEHFFCSTRIK
jgi:hypothetical protein